MLDERLGNDPFLAAASSASTPPSSSSTGSASPACRAATRTIPRSSPRLNLVSSVGGPLLGCSTFPFLWNVWRTARKGQDVNVDDPWGYGNSLEWATSCPPPRHNFTAIPLIRSERPAFDMRYPRLGTTEQEKIPAGEG